MKPIVGIDPGPERSGFVIVTPDLLEPGRLPSLLDADAAIRNDLVLEKLAPLRGVTVCCEVMNNIRATAGIDTFETCYWIGEFRAACKAHELPWEPIMQSDVKKAMIGTRNGKPALVRREIIRRYSYGIDDPKRAARVAIGSQTRQGPLYGVSDHAWMALAVTLTHIQNEKEKQDAVNA
jgi:Holliday junction resolvasome RuvABC endonuclease subunit